MKKSVYLNHYLLCEESANATKNEYIGTSLILVCLGIFFGHSWIFDKFQPQHSYKAYSYNKVCVMPTSANCNTRFFIKMLFHQGSTILFVCLSDPLVLGNCRSDGLKFTWFFVIIKHSEPNKKGSHNYALKFDFSPFFTYFWLLIHGSAISRVCKELGITLLYSAQ